MRVATVRLVLAFLLSFLLAPDFGVSTAHAHTAAPGTRAEGPAHAVGGAAHLAQGPCGTVDRGSEQNGLLRHRDRNRSATVPPPEAPPRSVVAQDAGGALAPAAVAAMGDAMRASRSSGTRSAPALQVFRC
ncbi:hypothetical protein ABZ172_03540 [Streptomyces sp. NPDC006296]|uniref:hypothetical protein n=1 Tax=Streptomyces sp. NPDC006296 TaxID=3156746 RepID=UPI0033AE81FA